MGGSTADGFYGRLIIAGTLVYPANKSRGGTGRSLHRRRTASVFKPFGFIADFAGCIFGDQRIFCREADSVIPKSRRVDGIRH